MGRVSNTPDANLPFFKDLTMKCIACSKRSTIANSSLCKICSERKVTTPENHYIIGSRCTFLISCEKSDSLTDKVKELRSLAIEGKCFCGEDALEDFVFCKDHKRLASYAPKKRAKSSCSIEGCDNYAYKNGVCSRHSKNCKYCGKLNKSEVCIECTTKLRLKKWTGNLNLFEDSLGSVSTAKVMGVSLKRTSSKCKCGAMFKKNAFRTECSSCSPRELRDDSGDWNRSCKFSPDIWEKECKESHIKYAIYLKSIGALGETRGDSDIYKKWVESNT